jgi:hypothetical protein
MFSDLEKKVHKQNLALDKKYAINRPAFISGGVRQDRIRKIKGTLNNPRIGRYSSGVTTTGPFYAENGNAHVSGWDTTSYNTRIGFDASLVVRTGPDMSGTNVSTRLWRKVS